ncbi:MerR family transcriptional regulator [Actinoplanes teichomyceticus]|uniref:MerR family transcriptional regulator n=1 Tax=Actinoplanes teichomyceticus TaxID=1867 RepID=A0A561WMS5_ACTTI|nr:MerR family transcriptional regulator [Actinoplanes teichomyceticus]TWG25187.1 MerR family transcriptional regulator [Actinoplanes teichomyceticus]GIF10256.1 MerR family transcriptional regulator [Actinoplanes teichomyceticus]
MRSQSAGPLTTGPMSIGEFARLSGLSIKALRLYDVSGLLPAAEVDPITGYRRYAAAQLKRARRIGVLRRIGMPLPVIGEMLVLSDAEAVGRLDRWWAGEEAATAARRSGHLWLRTSLAHGDEPERDYPVRAVQRPQRKVATIRTEVDQQGLVPAIGAAQWSIRAHLDRHGARHTPEHWVIYHGLVTPDTEAAIEVCVPYSGSAEPGRDIALRIEPAQSLACATVLRDDCFYPRITAAYQAVHRHLTAAGLVAAGLPRETYLDHWDRLAGDAPFAHVAQPVEE